MLQLQHKNSGKGPLWLVNSTYSIGCTSSSDVKLPKISATEAYAQLLVNGDELELVNISDDEAPKVNGVAVSDKRMLVAGDVITIGEEELLILDPKEEKRQAPGLSGAGAEQEAAPLWAFKALNTALADKQFPLKESQVLGRSNECDITLGVVHLSRKHATVTVTDSGLLIEDLDSSNGTFVNAKKITRATAVAGDEVRFDTLRFQVIGPALGRSKTTECASADSDMTTVRPALNLADHGFADAAKPSASGSAQQSEAAKPKKPPSSARPSQPSQTVRASQADEGKNSNVVTYAILLALVVAGVAAAWFILGAG